MRLGSLAANVLLVAVLAACAGNPPSVFAPVPAGSVLPRATVYDTRYILRLRLQKGPADELREMWRRAVRDYREDARCLYGLLALTSPREVPGALALLRGIYYAVEITDTRQAEIAYADSVSLWYRAGEAGEHGCPESGGFLGVAHTHIPYRGSEHTQNPGPGTADWWTFFGGSEREILMIVVFDVAADGTLRLVWSLRHGLSGVWNYLEDGG